MALKDVIGQDKAIRILLGALSRDRIPSAYLFTGESGIGKKFTAINLAKVLNCQNTNSSAFSVQRSANNSELLDCCEHCPSCRKIDSQTHPDFLMILPEKGEVRVDEIRAIEEALSFAPYEGRRKIVIVDDAETMNPSAANAFLKTLEEPPPHSLIILISSSPDRLPETIRSRCSRITFLPLPPDKCKDVIQKIRSQKEKEKIFEELSIVARLSMGRPGLAVSDDLIEERDWFIRLFQEMANRGNKEGWADKDEIETWFNISFIFLRDIAVFKMTGKEDILINMDMKDRIATMSKTIELKDIMKSYIKLSFLRGYLGFNLNKSITWNYVSSIMQNLKIKMQK